METSEDKFFENLARLASGEGDATPALAKGAAAAQAKPAVKKAADDGGTGEPEGQLTIDVYQTPSDIIVESAVAGVKPEDLDINVSSDSITIRGERRRESEVSDDDYLYQECYWGRFARSVILPQEVDPDAASVSFKNGVLRVRLPKLNRERTKKLKVRLE